MAATDRFAILGPGKAGTAVGHLLRRAGYEITAVAGRRLDAARQAVSYTGGAATTDFAQAARGADWAEVLPAATDVQTAAQRLRLYIEGEYLA